VVVSIDHTGNTTMDIMSYDNNSDEEKEAFAVKSFFD
jgi:hypothetical protein